MLGPMTAYDEVLYPNYIYPQSHPDRLATVATLMGMRPAPVEASRVLELACGDGSNMLPLALDFPASEFVGVDLAALPIEHGRKVIAELGLKNIALHQMDLTRLPDSLGQFDYIIAHGLFSWVPPSVQDRVMAVCAEKLSPHGVAYISYNTYPGCRLREITRDMMLFHTKDVSDVRERVAQSRALIKWLADAQVKSSAYQMFLQETQKAFEQKRDAALYHDDLAEINSPVYFHQFVNHAARHGLQFLSEADYMDTQYHGFSSEVTEQLRQMSDENVLVKEQYLDFLKGRSFRQTLLCRHNIELDRSFKPELIKNFYISTEAKPVSAEPDLESDAVEEFAHPMEGRMATNNALAKAAMLHLSRIHPRGLRFEELQKNARSLIARGQSSDEDEEQTLAATLMQAYGAGIIELKTHQPEFTLEVSARPEASSLARVQARDGEIITTLLYRTIKLDDALSRQLLLLLDGARDHAEILSEMRALIEAGFEKYPMKEEMSDEKEQMLQALPSQLEEKLKELARLGLLKK